MKSEPGGVPTIDNNSTHSAIEEQLAAARRQLAEDQAAMAREKARLEADRQQLLELQRIDAERAKLADERVECCVVMS
jgi:hypothetical protein